MDLGAVLDRITARAAELGITDAELSRAATGASPDLIRNWRRSLKGDKPAMPRLDNLNALARELGVSADWLITGQDGAAQPALAEPEAAPWQPPEGFQNDPAGVARALTRSAARPSAFRVAVDLPGFGLFAGDVLICDQRRLPEPGDLALGNAATEDGFTTVIGRYLPPYLITGTALSTGAALAVDHDRVTLYHPVVAAFRGYGDQGS
jgi:transcriptional regulator with XRE-family HTH domain